MPPNESVVDAISHDLALRIMRGELAPGARLPAVRALANEHDVNVTTIQRVLVRLEERGLVRVLPRAGVEVLDVSRYGGVGLWPYVLDEAYADPSRAIELVRDAFDARRFLAIHVLEGMLERPYAEYERDLRARIEAFAAAVEDPPQSPQRLLTLEAEILRTLLIAARRPAVLAIHNDLQAMLAASADLVAALYADPHLNLHAWRTLETFLEQPAPSLPLDGLATAMAALDERITLAFERRIRR